MALIWADRVLETTTTTGTGVLTLAGAVTGYKAFSSRFATNDTGHYMIEGVDGSGVPTGEWETGLGTYSGSNAWTRTTVVASSNSDAAVSFSAGTKRVALTQTAGFVSTLVSGAQFVGMPMFRGNNGTVVGQNFYSGRSIVIPFSGKIAAIAAFCTAAQATAKLLPGVYTSDGSGNIATLLATGPQVTGVTFGLNVIPLTAPLTVTAGDVVYVGCQLTVINTAFAAMASNIDTVAFSSSSALPSTAGAGSYGTNGGDSFFVKMTA